MLDDREFARLLDFLHYSWKGYRKVRKGVKKRVTRHMQELGCRRMEDYLQRLRSDPAVRAECERRMTVSISRFFRDLRLWEILFERVLPALYERSERAPRVWFAGCAGGEEVYSFRILLEEWRSGRPDFPEPEIIATDKNPEYIKRAKKGIYPRGALRDVDVQRRGRWFDPAGKSQYAVAPVLAGGICWQVHDLLADNPPGGGDFDLIFLRNNLLTYFQADLMGPAFDRVVEALAPAGFLVAGAGEAVPPGGQFTLCRYDRYVYRKPA